MRGPRAELYGSAYARACSQRRVQGEGERFCFLVTFIWALGDVGVRALHKSGVAVCECGHRDINPGARRLPSGYLFLLFLLFLLLRLFFVAPVHFPNLFLSPLAYLLVRSFSSLSLSLSMPPSSPFAPCPLVSRPYRGILEHSMVHPVLHIMYPTTVFRCLLCLLCPRPSPA